MKFTPLRLMLGACLSISTCAFGQTGTASAAAPAAPAAAPPANPSSPAATGQNNNPSAIPPTPQTPASPTTNGSMPITPQNPQTQANPGAPGQVPSTIGTTAPATAAPGSVSTTNGSGQIFANLDGGKKGYLSSADVASNKFLAGHFQQCDTNSDGRLTQSETGLCMQQMPPGER